MNKKLQLVLASVFLGLAIWLFIWPAFGPYISFVIPLPGTSEIRSIRVERDFQGRLDAYIDYFFTGRPTSTDIKVDLLAASGSESTASFSASQWKPSAVRGTHTAKIKIQRPLVEEAINTTRVLVKLSDRKTGNVIASKSIDYVIQWPDRKSHALDEKVNSEPQAALLQEAIGSIKNGSSGSVAEAKALLERLVQKDPKFASGIEQLVRIATIAPWGPEGISKIESRDDMHNVVNGLLGADAYDELNELAFNLIQSQALSVNGNIKLPWFHAVLRGSHLVLPPFKEAELRKMEAEDYVPDRLLARKAPWSYLSKINTSEDLLRAAWQIRGSGYANSVSKEDFARFQALALRSVDVLASCKAQCDFDPQWYASMIYAMGSASMSRAKIGPVFVEGFTKFPWYPPIYLNMATNFAPQWGGSVQELESFAKELTNRLSPSDKDMVYARFYDSLYSSRTIPDPLAKPGVMSCSRAIKGFDSISSRWPTNLNFNLTLRMARWCNDKSTARRYLAIIGNQADLTVLTATDFANSVAWAKQ
jgi:hypothetical protein